MGLVSDLGRCPRLPYYARFAERSKFRLVPLLPIFPKIVAFPQSGWQIILGFGALRGFVRAPCPPCPGRFAANHGLQGIAHDQEPSRTDCAGWSFVRVVLLRCGECGMVELCEPRRRRMLPRRMRPRKRRLPPKFPSCIPQRRRGAGRSSCSPPEAHRSAGTSIATSKIRGRSFPRWSNLQRARPISCSS